MKTIVLLSALLMYTASMADETKLNLKEIKIETETELALEDWMLNADYFSMQKDSISVEKPIMDEKCCMACDKRLKPF